MVDLQGAEAAAPAEAIYAEARSAQPSSVTRTLTFALALALARALALAQCLMPYR